MDGLCEELCENGINVQMTVERGLWEKKTCMKMHHFVVVFILVLNH